MKFVDEAFIDIAAGDGGNGCVSFRHEKYKEFGGELISAGAIIVRQRGTKFHPGNNVGIGKDHTLFALVDGHVSFAIKGALNKHTVSVTAA